MMTTIRLQYATVAAAATAIMLGGAATARAGRYEIGIGATAHDMASPSMDAVTASDSHTLFSADAAVRLGPAPLGSALAAGLEYQAGTISGTTFQTIESDMTVQSAVAFARLSEPLRWAVRGFVRAGVGFSHVSLTLSDPYSGSEALSDGGFGFTAAGGAGFEYSLFHISRHVPIVLQAELGYAKTSGISLRAIPESRTGNGDTLHIPAAYASLGDVDLSGWTFRFGAVARF